MKDYPFVLNVIVLCGVNKMFTKKQLKEQKFNDEQWQEYETKVIKYFNMDLKEGTEEYNKYQMGDL